MNHISLIMAYYDNREMLAHQYQFLYSLPDYIRESMELILVDDCSPRWPAFAYGKVGLDVKIFRLRQDIRWNQDACRNIGVKEARYPWVLLTDMDHVVPLETWDYIINSRLDPSVVYRFARLSAPDMGVVIDPRNGKPKPHPNSWLMTSGLFQRIGGYDERFAGWYGTDGDFRNRVAIAAAIILLDQPLIVYSREIIPDASTTTYERKTTQDREAINKIIIQRGRSAPINGRFPYDQVYP